MFRHRFHTAQSLRTRVDWLILSFLAGCVNAGGYMATFRFVSHVTGFATLFGIDAAHGKWDQAIGILSVPGFFLLGVMTSAWLIDRRVYMNKHPHYATVMGLVFSCLGLAALGGSLGWFGVFGHELRLRQDYFLLALLCAASGLQNAAITTASGATVRTTHLTGLTTDLGTGLVRALSNPAVRGQELRAARMRLSTILAFATGSAVSAVAYLRFEYLGFLLPAVLALYCVYEALRPQRRLLRLRRHARRMGG